MPKGVGRGKGKKILPKQPEPSADMFDSPCSSSEGESEVEVDGNTLDDEEPYIPNSPLGGSQQVEPDPTPQHDDEGDIIPSTQDSTQSTDTDATQMSQVLKTKVKKNEKAGQKKKKERTYAIIPEDKEVSIMEWYRDQEFLYNKKMRAYRDRDKKSKAWEDKAQSLDTDGKSITFHFSAKYINMILSLPSISSPTVTQTLVSNINHNQFPNSQPL